MIALPDGLWLNVGSGPSAPAGWTSIDGSWQAWLAARPALARAARRLTGRAVGHWPRGIVCRDVRRGLGVAAGSAAVVFTSHFIEHLHRADALAFLREARRALIPGGICRVVTPDLRALVDGYVASRVADPLAGDRLQEALLLHPAAPAPVPMLLGWYRARTAFDHHKWVYDGESLAALFREAGFPHPTPRGHLDSDIPRERLAAVEPADRVCGGAGVCVEARA
jgi:hypothetical protein